MNDMYEAETIRLCAGAVRAEIDPSRAALVALSYGDREFVAADATGSLVRVAAPVEGYDAHWMRPGGVAPRIEQGPQQVTLTYDRLVSAHTELEVSVRIQAGIGDEGLILRAEVANHGDVLIPQVAFPQLQGLVPREPGHTAVLQLPGRRMRPFEELVMRPEDMSFLEVPLQEYIHYGCLDFTMKWFDFGDSRGGFSVYSTNTRYTTQGLLVERQDRFSERLNLRWAHYPELRAGETWDSGEFVVVPHEGDWYAGARAYQRFAAEQYPYNAPRHIREALAVRSIWPALRNTRPTFTFKELPEYALEAADESLGIGEVVLWHWWLKNGLPIVIDERLGDEAELREALAACRDGGVRMSMFVSHHILREGDETDPSWVHRNRAGQAIVWNWTYSDEYLPKFPVLFQATHSMVKASALSRGWRETALAEYRRIMDLGAESICFDVFYAWNEPDYSPTADGRPDEAGERLKEFGRQAREIVHAVRPEGTFSGEWPSDIKVPIIDYTWDWRNARDVADCAPFRYVFPQFRLNANVGAHPRGPALAFMEGALLNVMPGGLRTQRLADNPELVEQLRRLAALRRRFLPFFTDGQYHHLEGVSVSGGEVRLYACDGAALLVLCNAGDDQATISVEVEPERIGLARTRWHATAYPSDGTRFDAGSHDQVIRLHRQVAPDDVIAVHLVPEQEAS